MTNGDDPNPFFYFHRKYKLDIASLSLFMQVTVKCQVSTNIVSLQLTSHDSETSFPNVCFLFQSWAPGFVNSFLDSLQIDSIEGGKCSNYLAYCIVM